MKYKPVIIFLLTLCIFQSFYSVASANYNYLEDKKKQILYFKLDLEEIDKKISKNNEQIASLTSELKKYDEEFLKITELLKNIENNQFDTTNLANYQNESEIIQYSDKLEKLKNSFKQKIIWLYKHGAEFGLEILFSSSTFNDFYVKLEYLQRISQIRKKDFEKIRYYEYIVEEKKKLFNLSKAEKLSYITSKKEDQRSLIENRILADEKIQVLKKENDSYGREITLKNNLVVRLQSEIASQKSDMSFELMQAVNYNSDDFGKLQNKLIYPVNSNYLLLDFDKTIDLFTNTITYNNGIDLSISRNSDVRCVADGTVEDIQFIPSYGNVVLIKHSGEFRTVYAVLKDIDVKINQDVKAGEVIAKTSDNFNGQCFHFEIWNGLKPLDPKKWIHD